MRRDGDAQALGVKKAARAAGAPLGVEREHDVFDSLVAKAVARRELGAVGVEPEVDGGRAQERVGEREHDRSGRALFAPGGGATGRKEVDVPAARHEAHSEATLDADRRADVNPQSVIGARRELDHAASPRVGLDPRRDRDRPTPSRCEDVARRHG